MIIQSGRKMEKSTWRLPTIQRSQRLIGIDGEPKWAREEYFPGITTLGILQKIEEDLNVRQINPEQFEGKILSVSMFNDFEWTKKGNSSQYFSNSGQVKGHARRFPRGHWSFPGPGEENTWYGTHTYKPEGKWNEVADLLVNNFKESGHPIFPGISALNRGILKREGRKCTIHFTAESSNTEPLFRTIRPANQLSVYGAVASWCEERAHTIPGQTHMIMEKSVAKDNNQLSQKLEPQEVDSLVQSPRRNGGAAGHRLRVSLRQLEELEKEVQLIRRVSVGMHYKTGHNVNDGFEGSTGACREYTLSRDDPESEVQLWIKGHTRSSSQGHMFS